MEGIILEILKSDLGIKHEKRDEYFKKLIQSAIKQLERKGVISENEYDVEYSILVSDLVSWNYRHRQENVPMAMNIQQRIRDRIVRLRTNASGQ